MKKYGNTLAMSPTDRLKQIVSGGLKEVMGLPLASVKAKETYLSPTPPNRKVPFGSPLRLGFEQVTLVPLGTVPGGIVAVASPPGQPAVPPAPLSKTVEVCVGGTLPAKMGGPPKPGILLEELLLELLEELLLELQFGFCWSGVGLSHPGGSLLDELLDEELDELLDEELDELLDEELDELLDEELDELLDEASHSGRFCGFCPCPLKQS
jgi:hypothetical protein